MRADRGSAHMKKSDEGRREGPPLSSMIFLLVPDFEQLLDLFF